MQNNFKINKKIISFFLLIPVFLAGYFASSHFLKSNKTIISQIAETVIGKEEEKSSGVIGKYLSASVAKRSGDYEGAIKQYEKSLNEYPNNQEILDKLYGLYLFVGDYDKALTQSRRNIQIDLEKQVTAINQHAVPYLIAALEDYKNKKFTNVIKSLDPLADPKIEDSTHLDGVVMPIILAWSYANQSDFKSAFVTIDSITSQYMLSIFSYNRALINDIANGKKIEKPIYETSIDSIAEIFFEIAQHAASLGNFEESSIYLRLAIYVKPHEYKYQKALAYNFEALNRLEDVIKIYSSIDKKSKFYNDAQFSKSIAYNNLGKAQAAKKILQKLKNTKGYEYKATFALGTIFMANQDYKHAIEYFEQAKLLIEKLSPDNWNLFFNLGVAYDRTDVWNKAEENLKVSVRLVPNNPEVLNYLAYSWLVRNLNINQARKMLEAAVVRSGGAPHILDSYGWALFKLGYYKQAIPFLEQASAAMPYNPVINDHLGDLYWKLNRHREAHYQWKKALDFFNTDVENEISLDDINLKLKESQSYVN